MSIEAYQPLCDRLGLDVGIIPYTPKWSAAPDFLELIVDHALTHKPATIVECGSGLTTVMLARCCAMNGGGHLFSLENGAEFAAQTRAAVSGYRLGEFSTVIDAPLVPHTINGRDYRWYALDDMTMIDIDMLVIDGPPGFIQQHSRYPALPLLFDRLAEGCTVFMDDAARPDERELVEMWLAEFPVNDKSYVANERGCSVLRLAPSR